MPADIQHRLFGLVSRAGVLLGSPRIEDVLPGILHRRARKRLGRRLRGLAAGSRAPPAWVIVGHQGVSEEFAAAVISSHQGQPAGVVVDPNPIAAEDVLRLPMLEARREAYVKEGIASMLAIPLLIDGEASGSLVFYYRRRHAFPADEIEMARAVGHLAGAALRTAELHSQQTLGEQRALFLARAAAALAASLDYHETLKTVTQMAVPHIADWCAVDILNSAGELEQLALAHADPARVELARAFRASIRRPGVAERRPYVVRTGNRSCLSHLTDEMIARGARDDEHRREVRALGIPPTWSCRSGHARAWSAR